MSERERICILCGGKELMLGHICSACQERIQLEAARREKKTDRPEGEVVVPRKGERNSG